MDRGVGAWRGQREQITSHPQDGCAGCGPPLSAEEGDHGLFVAMLASLPLPKAPGPCHPPIPHPAAAGQQECINNPISVKNCPAAAWLSRLRGRAGSRVRGQLGRRAPSPYWGRACLQKHLGTRWPEGRAQASRCPGDTASAPHPCGRCWGACGRRLGHRHSESRPGGAGGVQAVQEGAVGGGWALVPAGVSAFRRPTSLEGKAQSFGFLGALSRPGPGGAPLSCTSGGCGWVEAAGALLSLGFGLTAEACGEREEMASLGADLLGTEPRCPRGGHQAPAAPPPLPRGCTVSPWVHSDPGPFLLHSKTSRCEMLA